MLLWVYEQDLSVIMQLCNMNSGLLWTLSNLKDI